VEEIRAIALATARRFLHRPQDAEDVAQEVVVRALRAQSNGHPVVHPPAFAVTVATRLAVDRLRRQHRDRDRAAAREREQPRFGDADSSLDANRLYEAVASLPPQQAAVITLRKLYEMEYAEVAAILGLSEVHCRVLCSQGIKRLRALLKERNRQAIQP